MAALLHIYGGTIMAYIITDACVKCGACADNCPVEAISEGEDKYVIDADTCVSCGACCDNCPVEAIEEG
jgi:ferredoxin